MLNLDGVPRTSTHLTQRPLVETLTMLLRKAQGAAGLAPWRYVAPIKNLARNSWMSALWRGAAI